MSHADALYTKALTAAEITSKLIAMAPTIWPGETVHFNVQTNVQGLNLSLTLPVAELASNPPIAKFLSTVEKRKQILASSAVMHRHDTGAIGVSYATPDGIVGRLMINMASDSSRIARTLDAIEKQFNVTSYVDLLRSTSPEIAHDALAVRERSVADLQEAVQKLADFQANLTVREIEQRQQLEKAQAASYQQRVDALDKEYRDRQAQLDKRKAADEAALATVEKAHADRVAQFETREAKYIRRELLKEIRTVLADAEKTALSGPTGSKRWWIHGFVWLLMAASGTLAGTMAYRIFSEQQPDWHILGPLTAGFVTFVLTTIYYLKWNDRWFREHADSEFSAKRYKADILRASWVAELVSERAKEGAGELPSDLLAAYTRNLFRDVGGSRVSEHPLDDLTALAKRATKVEIGKGVFSIEGERAVAKH